MKISLRATAVALAAACGGALAAAPAQADDIDGWGCGLTAWNNGSGYSYVIANCHTFGVNRRIKKSNGTVGSCRYIPGRALVGGSSELTIVGYEAC